MAKCRICKKPVSAKAKSCPNCQASNPAGQIGTAPSLIIIGLAAAVFFAIYSGDDAPVAAPAKAVAKLAPVNPKKRIDPSVFEPYEKADHSKTFALFGGRMDEVQQNRELAALKAIESGKCDHAYYSEISVTKSTPDSMEIFIDCKNGERFTFSEAQLASKGPIRTAKEMAWSEADAREACAQMIRQAAKYPSKLDVHHFAGTAASTAQTGNVRVAMDFEAMNGMGVMIPQRATCIFEPGAARGDMTIANR